LPFRLFEHHRSKVFSKYSSSFWEIRSI
jgi:hypothetical protein